LESQARKKLNILLVVSDLDFGGAQQIVVNLANELVKQQHDVCVFDVFPEKRQNGMLSKFDKNVNVITKDFGKIELSAKDKIFDFLLNKIHIKQNNNKLRNKYHRNNLYEMLLKVNFDVVNSHVCWADFFVFNNLKTLHKKWIISLHSSYFEWTEKYLRDKKFRQKTISKIFSSVHGVVFLINSELELIKLNLKSNSNFLSKKIFNGIPEPSLKDKYNKSDFGFSQSDFVVLCASRAIKEKGWLELAKAVDQLNLNHSKIKLLFAGDGPILSKMKNEYESENIRFLGFKSDILEIISISDLVVLPSYFEALPTSLIEAGFLEKPILATNVGDTIKILENNKGRCGIIIEAKTGLELEKILIKEIEKIYEKYKAGNIIQNNDSYRELKKIFCIKKMTYDYINFYNSIN
jgi:glycosyltransferase involved in cell wall biosynthesis